MSAKSSSLPEPSDVIQQIGPEPEPIPYDPEAAQTSGGNLGATVREISAAGRRRIDSEKYDAELADRKARQGRDEMQILWDKSGVPVLHKKAPWTWTAAQMEHINRMIYTFGTGAIWAILGEWGTGKTQLAAEVIRARCRQKRSARFTTAIELFVTLRSPFRDGGPRDESAVIATFLKPTVLVIDDAHVRAETDFENRLFHHILDHRHVMLTETILTSNQSADVFRDTIGGAIIDRMCAAGGIIECNWPSFRGKQETQT